MNSAAARSASAALILGLVFVVGDRFDAVDLDRGWGERVFVPTLAVTDFCGGAETKGLVFVLISGSVKAEDEAEVETPKVDEDVGKSRDGSKTDDEVVQREEEAINIDGLSVAEMKQMRESSEKHAFQAEVSRMMKLIINSLYKNKEVGKIIFSHV